MSALSGRKIKHLLGWTGEGSKLHMVASKTLTVNNSLTLAGTDGQTFTFPAVSDTVPGLATAQTWTAVQTFTNSDIKLLGSSTGVTTFTSANAGASNFTLTFPAITDTLATLTGVGTSVGGTASGSYSQASNTTLTAVAGMSVTLVAGATYAITGYLATTNNATGGIKVSFNGANTTATATTFLMDTWNYSTTTLNAEGNITALASNLVNAAVASTAVFFEGVIVVNAGGVLALYAGQNTSNGTALTIANGSYLLCTRVA